MAIKYVCDRCGKEMLQSDFVCYTIGNENYELCSSCSDIVDARLIQEIEQPITGGSDDKDTTIKRLTNKLLELEMQRSIFIDEIERLKKRNCNPYCYPVTPDYRPIYPMPEERILC